MKDIFAVIGAVVVLLAIFACGALGYGAYRMAVGANDAAIILNDFPATLEAIDGSFSQEPPVIGITVVPRTEPVGQVLVVTATAVPALPTSTPQPAPTATVAVSDWGLPDVGPYTKDQYALCVTLNINYGGLHVLSEPQRSLCQQYLDANNE